VGKIVHQFVESILSWKNATSSGDEHPEVTTFVSFRIVSVFAEMQAGICDRIWENTRAAGGTPLC
jgi:hypothetical protein